jgi:putative hydrolase of the HAD superfamily
MYPGDKRDSGSPPVVALFLDIGGVLLTNGWDHNMRRRAAEAFDLDYEEMNERHHLTFDTYEEGKHSLSTYLQRVVFYRDRSFTPEEFRAFMFAQSEPYSDMIRLVKKLKSRYNLRVGAVSNEGRELTEYRIEKFELRTFMDFFISSCFVHLRKPDEDIYRIALDIAQVPADQVVYIEDRTMFADVAQSLGIQSIHHVGYSATREALRQLGLSDGET